MPAQREVKSLQLTGISLIAKFKKTISSLLTTNNSRSGFTLIELLVAISIIAIISAVGLVSFSQSQKLARDSRRKQDLEEINKLLQLYYSDNGKFPPSPCGYGCNNYYYSTAGSGWLTPLASYSNRLPTDPINNTASPWVTGNYSYTYGNVSANGDNYDLTAQLENQKDPERCGQKGWRYGQGIGGPYIWCLGDSNQFPTGQNYSNHIYEAAPDR